MRIPHHRATESREKDSLKDFCELRDSLVNYAYRITGWPVDLDVTPGTHHQ